MRFAQSLVLLTIAAVSIHARQITAVHYNPDKCATCVTSQVVDEKEIIRELKKLEKIKENSVGPQVWEMTQFRRAEAYYNLAKFDRAIDLLYACINLADAGIYKRKDFREMALEYMANCFYSLPNGTEKALDYFQKTGARPFENQLVYTIGMKKRNHDQYAEAIASLKTAVARFPSYKDAPRARQIVAECYNAMNSPAQAAQERERLVDDYSPGGDWYARNSEDPEALARARTVIMQAMGYIAGYYDSLSSANGDPGAIKKALKRYEDYIIRYPADLIGKYECHFRAAEIYAKLGSCEDAARHFGAIAKVVLREDSVAVPQTAASRVYSEPGNAVVMSRSDLLVSPADAALREIKSLDECRIKKLSSLGINEEQGLAIGETKRLLEAIERSQTRFFKTPQAAEGLFIAGNVYYKAKSYDRARRSFGTITDMYPDTPFAGTAKKMAVQCDSAQQKK